MRKKALCSSSSEILGFYSQKKGKVFDLMEWKRSIGHWQLNYLKENNFEAKV